MPFTVLKFRTHGDAETAKLLEDVVYQVLLQMRHLRSSDIAMPHHFSMCSDLAKCL